MSTGSQHEILRRLWHQKYLIFLISLMVLIAVAPTLAHEQETRLPIYLIVTVVYLSALVAVFHTPRSRWIGTALGLPSLATFWLSYLAKGDAPISLLIAAHFIAVVFFIYGVVVILRTIYEEPTVTINSIFAAICGYLLIGIAFGHLYRIVESTAPGAVQFAGAPETTTKEEDEGKRQHILVYFSFVTLTTVGYGDITPNHPMVRSLAVVEAIIGQFYIAALIGDLIGKRLSQVVSARTSEPAPKKTDS